MLDIIQHSFQDTIAGLLYRGSMEILFSERLHPYRAHNWHSFPKPSKAQEAVWQRYLKRCFLGRGRQLCQPLGAWITVDTGWEWFFSPQDRNLYCKTETGWL